MCGIAGVYGLTGRILPEWVDATQTMLDLSSHRGPDDQGLLQLRALVMGHRRLSIVDLSATGHQPMTNESQTVWVAFNGEIYNHPHLRHELQSTGHRFVSSSDTEVLVHGYEQWGMHGLLQRLEGMFAFALYDLGCVASHKTCPGRIFLVRDRFGIKPLYYTLGGSQFMAFASEVRPLRRSGLVPESTNEAAWFAFLMLGSVPGPMTTLRGVSSLAPGRYLTFHGSDSSEFQYYDREALFRESTVVRDPSPAGKTHETVRQQLNGSVRSHLFSDAPLGVFLSGGIDSSVLVALAAEHSAQLKTISVTFDGSSPAQSARQRMIADQYRTNHSAVALTLEDFKADLIPFLDNVDEPTIDGLNTYFIAKAAKQAGLKAVLSGIGSDEIFCGYRTQRRAVHLARIRALPSLVRRLLLAAVSSGRFRRLSLLNRTERLAFYMVQRGLFLPSEAASILGANEAQAWRTLEALEPVWGPDDPVLLQQWLEFSRYLVDQLLKDADVFGMASSVEIRVPYLHHPLVEAVLGTPLSVRMMGQWPKGLLTRAVENRVPMSVITQRKQPFSLPVHRWLRSARAYLEELSPNVQPRSHRAVWYQFLEGKAHWSHPWALLVMEHLRSGQP